MSEPKVKKAAEWYSKNIPTYRALASRVESIVIERLSQEKIPYYSVDSRAKSIESYARKASDEKYEDPISQITDMAGVRIITYTNNDAKRIAEIVKEAFEIDPTKSVDKAEELGVDKVGYRSIHFVGALGTDRLKLPENKVFKDLCFEIQIRSILQHAWAEFEHDRNYKFSGVLPNDLKRRLSILAGNLELVDREFDRLSQEIDDYTIEVRNKTIAGDLSIPINSKSLMEYMNHKFKQLVEAGLVNPTFELVSSVIIQELLDMGIDTIEKLDQKVPKGFSDNYFRAYTASKHKGNFTGTIRTILVASDPEAYFKKAWKRKWLGIGKNDLAFWTSYNPDFHKIVQQYHLMVV